MATRDQQRIILLQQALKIAKDMLRLVSVGDAAARGVDLALEQIEDIERRL